jgi:hypothetical protein
LKKIIVLFLILAAAPVVAQSSLQCVDLQQGFDFEVGTQDPQEAIQDLQTKVKKMAACLKAMQFDMSIHDPGLMESQIDDNRKTLIALEDRLYDTEDSLKKAEEKIEMLELRLSMLEPRPRARMGPARKPIPDFIPATPPHPASKKSGVGKPTTPVNK